MTSTSAQIQKFNTNAQGRTEYFIKIYFLGKEWAIRKRYSDFLAFDKAFRRSGHCSFEYKLPPKKWWDRFEEKTLAQRQRGLQQYLDFLLSNSICGEVSLIREFLEVDENMLALARKQSFREFSESDFLVALAQNMKQQLILIISDAAPLKQRSISQRNRLMSMGYGGSFHAVGSPSSTTVDCATHHERNRKYPPITRSHSSSILSNDRVPSHDIFLGTKDTSVEKWKFQSAVNYMERFEKHCMKHWEEHRDLVEGILEIMETPWGTTYDRNEGMDVIDVLGQPLSIPEADEETLIVISSLAFKCNNDLVARLRDVDASELERRRPLSRGFGVGSVVGSTPGNVGGTGCRLRGGTDGENGLMLYLRIPRPRDGSVMPGTIMGSMRGDQSKLQPSAASLDDYFF